jgi:hypothetical protein
MKRSLFVVLLVAAAGCATGPKHVVPDNELAVLGGKGLEAVEAAREKEAAARQALAARRAEEVSAEREVKIAQYAIEREEADLAVARLRFEAVQETHEAEAMLPANARRTQAEHAVATAKAELTYRRAASDHASARVDEAEAAINVALNEVERAKLDAVLGTDPNVPPAQAQRRAAFDAQLANAQATLAERSSAVVRAAGAMESAEAAWKAMGSKP